MAQSSRFSVAADQFIRELQKFDSHMSRDIQQLGSLNHISTTNPEIESNPNSHLNKKLIEKKLFKNEILSYFQIKKQIQLADQAFQIELEKKKEEIEAIEKEYQATLKEAAQKNMPNQFEKAKEFLKQEEKLWDELKRNIAELIEQINKKIYEISSVIAVLEKNLMENKNNFIELYCNKIKENLIGTYNRVGDTIEIIIGESKVMCNINKLIEIARQGAEIEYKNAAMPDNNTIKNNMQKRIENYLQEHSAISNKHHHFSPTAIMAAATKINNHFEAQALRDALSVNCIQRNQINYAASIQKALTAMKDYSVYFVQSDFVKNKSLMPEVKVFYSESKNIVDKLNKTFETKKENRKLDAMQMFMKKIGTLPSEPVHLSKTQENGLKLKL